MWETPVEHEPWPLRAAHFDDLAESVTRAAGLPSPADEPGALLRRGAQGPPRSLTASAAAVKEAGMNPIWGLSFGSPRGPKEDARDVESGQVDGCGLAVIAGGDAYPVAMAQSFNRWHSSVRAVCARRGPPRADRAMT
ncbi:hypothetical protein A6P39_45245 [Streptomyces sp. FXJ1.172]|uniref:hypothetical protein n=1 Tax=Streptomyces sp. FXJ1.172 TaxID=710705 RepID=UPI002F42D7B7